MGNGYWQRMLRVDLTNRTTEVQPIDGALLRALIGGAGEQGRTLTGRKTA